MIALDMPNNKTATAAKFVRANRYWHRTDGPKLLCTKEPLAELMITGTSNKTPQNCFYCQKCWPEEAIRREQAQREARVRWEQKNPAKARQDRHGDMVYLAYWADRDVVRQVERAAARDGITRSEWLSQAVQEKLGG